MSAAAVAFFVSFLLLQAKMKGHNSSQGETGTAPAAAVERNFILPSCRAGTSFFEKGRKNFIERGDCYAPDLIYCCMLKAIALHFVHVCLFFAFTIFNSQYQILSLTFNTSKLRFEWG